jgi:uncharacterized protein
MKTKKSYHSPPMPQQGYVIDSLSFAREGRQLDGAIEIRSLSRLADALADTSGNLQFVVSGDGGADGDFYLVLTVGGVLALCCQRCLEPYQFPLSVERRFLLVGPGREWPDDELANDNFDAIAADREMDVAALVEQEVVLALPLAPRHDICAAPRAADGRDNMNSSAFAALVALKRSE